MLSEGADKLRDALRRQGGRLLCMPCVAAETGLNIYEARKAIRELILDGGVLASPFDTCSACRRPDLIVKLRRV